MSLFSFVGRVIAAPVRLANIPVKIAAKVVDASLGGPTSPVKHYDPLALDEVAEAIEDTTK